MSAQRPSDLLKNKTNVHPVVNRSTQATAEDFGEAGAILEDHANLLDTLLAHSGSDFYGVFASLAALQAAYPVLGISDEGSYALITVGTGNPIDIAVYTILDGWQIVDQTDQVLLYTNRAAFPAEGQEKIWYIDKAATKAYLWYNAGYNLYFGAGILSPARPLKKNYLPLNGVSLTQEPLAIVADAILLHAPWTCVAGQKMAFYTISVVGTQDNYGYEIKYYLLNLNITEITESSDLSITAADIIPLGNIPPRLVAEDDNELVAPLGNIGTDLIEDVFNEGNAGDPWVLKDILFVTATQNIGGDDVLKRYLFVAEPGLYGGDDLGTDPDILEAFAPMFIDITDAPTIPSTINKLFYEDIAAMIAHQAEQTIQTDLEVEDASDDTNITFASGETRKWATYRWLGTTDGDIDDYRLISAPYGNRTGALKQVIQEGNFVLTVTDNDATVSMDGGTCTIDPNTQAYQDAYVVAMKNITDSTDGSIVCTEATGWTYKVNDNASVASGTFTFPAGATCTIIKFEGTNKIYIDGGVE